MANVIKAAIFASGSGSNAESIIRYAQNCDLEITCLITDQKDAGVIARVSEFGIPVHVVPIETNKHGSFQTAKNVQESHIHEILESNGTEWIFLAGYMRILSSEFLNRYYSDELGVNKVINIHPSLLPSFPGKDAYTQAWNSGVKLSGATVHFVDAGIDTGPPICQDSFPRKANDTLDDFIKRGLQVEYSLYRKAIDALISGKLKIKKIANSDKKIVYIGDEL